MANIKRKRMPDFAVAAGSFLQLDDVLQALGRPRAPRSVLTHHCG